MGRLTTNINPFDKAEKSAGKKPKIAWMPRPPKKKKESDLEKVIKTKKNKRDTINDILNSI